jgi:hypothetical protein
MVPPRAPSFCDATEEVCLGLPAGKAGLRPRKVLDAPIAGDVGPGRGFSLAPRYA